MSEFDQNIDYRTNPMRDNLSAKHPDRTIHQTDSINLPTCINLTMRSDSDDAALVIPGRSKLTETVCN